MLLDHIQLNSIKIQVNFFDSKFGISLYFLSTIIVMFLWIYCFSIGIIGASISLFGIPFVFFGLGSSYLKHKKDNHHLEIHRILMLIVMIAIIIFFVTIFVSIINMAIAQTIAIWVLVMDMIAAYGLYFNSFGGDNVIDFILTFPYRIKKLCVLLNTKTDSK